MACVILTEFVSVEEAIWLTCEPWTTMQVTYTGITNDGRAFLAAGPGASDP